MKKFFLLFLLVNQFAIFSYADEDSDKLQNEEIKEKIQKIQAIPKGWNERGYLPVPPELHSEGIFKYLDEESLFKLKLVSRAFNQESKRTFKSVDLCSKDGIRHVNVGRYFEVLIRSYSHCFPFAETLRLPDSTAAVDEESMMLILELFKKIKILLGNFRTTSKVLDKLATTQVESMTVNCNDVTTEARAQLGEKLASIPYLKDLSLKDCNLQEEDLHWLRSHPKLESIRYRTGPIYDHKDSILSAAQLPHLKAFTTSVLEINDSILDRLSQSLELDSLELFCGSTSTPVSHQVIEKLVHFTNLKKLTLHSCYIEDDDLILLRNYSPLRELSLDRSKLYSVEQLLNSGRFTSFSIRYTDYSSYHLFLEALKSNTALTEFSYESDRLDSGLLLKMLSSSAVNWTSLRKLRVSYEQNLWIGDLELVISRFPNLREFVIVAPNYFISPSAYLSPLRTRFPQVRIVWEIPRRN